MARKQQMRRTIPLPIERGMWSQGDGARLPVGYCRKVRNMLRKDGTWIARPKFTFDGLTGIQGLATGEDTNVSQITRLMSVDDDGYIRVKDIDAETWSVAYGPVVGTRLTSFATYRGVGYGTLDDGAGVPEGLFRFDTTGISTNPLNSNIIAGQLLFYKERMFLFHPRITIENLLPWQAAYAASGGQWQLANVDAREIVSGTTITGEIIPTATTGAYMYRDIEQIVALAEETRRVYLCDVHNTSASYQMPITLQMRLSHAWEATTSYVIGELVTPSASNGYRYRAIAGGTSDSGEPGSWPVVIGDTVTDGAVTWLCDATDVIDGAEAQAFIPTSANQSGFTRYVVSGKLPPTPSEYTLRAYIVFGNDTSSTITPVALHIGFRDGLVSGNPAKKNFGQQVTTGDYFFPFFNREDDTPAVLDLDEILWSEVANPKSFRSISFYNLDGTAGHVTAAVVFDGRIFVMKRRGITRFVSSEDPNLVILPETDETLGVGCLGPRAFDIHPGINSDKGNRPPTLYWIGENSIYALAAGVTTSGTSNAPRDILGDRMRTEVMDKGANWIENQEEFNTAELCIDQSQHIVYVHTQKGKLYAYDIADDAWSIVDAGGNSSVDFTGNEIRALAYHPVTQNMYVSFGTSAAGTPGLARLDARESTPQVSVSVTGMISFDGGATFNKSLSMTLSATVSEKFQPFEFPLYQSWNTIQTRVIFNGPDDDQISTSGVTPLYAELWPRALETVGPHSDIMVESLRLRYKGGASEFSISDIEADIQLLRDYYPKTMPSFEGSTL